MLNEKLLNLLKILGHVLVIILLLSPNAWFMSITWDADLNFLVSLITIALAFPYMIWAFGEKLGIEVEYIIN